MFFKEFFKTMILLNKKGRKNNISQPGLNGLLNDLTVIANIQTRPPELQKQ